MNEQDMKKFLGLMACTLQDLAELVKISCDIENIARYHAIRESTELLLKWVEDMK